MHRRAFMGLMVFCTGAGFPILAGAEEKKDDKKAQVARTVEMAPIAIPVVWKGLVTNYIYARIRLHLTHDVDVGATRAKEPYFKDFVVRAANRTPFTLPNDLNAIDALALEKAVLPGCATIFGPGLVTHVEVFEQTPQHRLARPIP